MQQPANPPQSAQLLSALTCSNLSNRHGKRNYTPYAIPEQMAVGGGARTMAASSSGLACL